METFEVGRDSMLDPVGQEHHGSELGPSRVSTQVNSPSVGQSGEQSLPSV